MQIMAHTIIIFFCAIFALVQLGETLKFKANIWSTDMTSHIDTSDAGFLNALKYEIAIAVGTAVLTMIFIYLCKKLSQQVSGLKYIWCICCVNHNLPFENQLPC